jgi:hypothetical protein
MPAGADDATYRGLFSVGEFRALCAAGALSTVGDYLARIAVAAIVYDAAGSVPASAASLAVTYLPWLAGAPLLVALAERHPHRRVTLGCDLARPGLVGIAAVPGLPVPPLPVLMLLERRPAGADGYLRTRPRARYRS